MREPENMSWYAVTVADGTERAMHAVMSRAPEHARPISEQEARAISAALRIERGTIRRRQLRGRCRPSSIHARLDALSEESIAHTEKLEAITSQVERVEGAVNDMTAGLTGRRWDKEIADLCTDQGRVFASVATAVTRSSFKAPIEATANKILTNKEKVRSRRRYDQCAVVRCRPHSSDGVRVQVYLPPAQW